MTEPTSVAARLADRITRVVADCPAVAGLARGPLGTYLPGRVVPGVAIRDGAVEVAVVARYGVPITEVDHQVREAVDRVAPGWPVDVRVEDIVVTPGPA